jgi:hypothetical protein
VNLQETMGLMYGPLSAFAVSVSGKALIASDELQAWDFCFNNENFPKFILVWTGESLRGSFQTASINRASDQKFDLIVSRNRGLQVDRAQTLAWGAGNATSLWSLAEQARDLIRCIETTPGVQPGLDEWPIEYYGCEQWNVPGWIIDAYRFHFGVFNFLPGHSDALVQALAQ